VSVQLWQAKHKYSKTSGDAFPLRYCAIIGKGEIT
jgi:hypothetical protein